MSLAESIEQPSQQVPNSAVAENSASSNAALELPAESSQKPGDAPVEEGKSGALENENSAGPTTAKKTSPDAKKPRKEPRKRDRRSAAAKKANPKKPSKIIKLRLVNNEPAPTFEEISLSTGGEGSSGDEEEAFEAFWLRVQLREFLLRFDKLCRIPSRYLPSLNDLTAPWSDQLYKSAIVSLLRMFSYDKTWLIPMAKQYIPIIEDCVAESFELWTHLEDFLIANDPYVSKANSFTGEHFRLELIRRLLVLTTATDTIRSTVTNDHESLQTLKKENAEQIKLLQDQFDAKVEQLKQNKETFADKKQHAERLTGEKIFKAEQTMYTRLRKYSLRTTPVGTDNFGNRYWILQQKGKEIWGTSVLCEMKVFPDDEERMVMESGLQAQLEVPKENGPPPAPPIGEEETKQEPKEEGEGPKRKRRRYVVKKRDLLSDRDTASLQYVSGQDNVLTLAGWIRGQIGPKQETLATDIETMAYYSCDG